MSKTSHKNTPARRLGPEAKKSIALDALSGMGVTQAARKNAVCRNSVYVQKNKAEAAMDAAFVDKTDNTVLFHLPVADERRIQTLSTQPSRSPGGQNSR
jgi:hypothetical protein